MRRLLRAIRLLTRKLRKRKPAILTRRILRNRLAAMSKRMSKTNRMFLIITSLLMAPMLTPKPPRRCLINLNCLEISIAWVLTRKTQHWMPTTMQSMLTMMLSTIIMKKHLRHIKRLSRSIILRSGRASMTRRPKTIRRRVKMIRSSPIWMIFSLKRTLRKSKISKSLRV